MSAKEEKTKTISGSSQTDNLQEKSNKNRSNQTMFKLLFFSVGNKHDPHSGQ